MYLFTTSIQRTILISISLSLKGYQIGALRKKDSLGNKYYSFACKRNCRGEEGVGEWQYSFQGPKDRHRICCQHSPGASCGWWAMTVTSRAQGPPGNPSAPAGPQQTWTFRPSRPRPPTRRAPQGSCPPSGYPLVHRC